MKTITSGFFPGHRQKNDEQGITANYEKRVEELRNIGIWDT